MKYNIFLLSISLLLSLNAIAEQTNLLGTWEATIPDNHYQMEVTYNQTLNQYEGKLKKQGVISQFVGFSIDELVWTASPTTNPEQLKEQQKWRTGSNGVSIGFYWQEGVVYLNTSTENTLNTSQTIFSRVINITNTECLFNWAQTYYPSLFSPLMSGLQFFSPYTYRYYKDTNAYVGVSSGNNHVYYQGPDGVLQDVGDLADWLTTAGCPTASPPNIETSPTNIECLFNWAQTYYPSLFSPLMSGLQFYSPYTYRHYKDTNAYVEVSSANNHVYYQGPDGVLQDVGDLSAWLTTAGCPNDEVLGARPFPVIFIHGIASSADTWASFRDFLIKNGGWIFGGSPSYDNVTKEVNGIMKGADFYTLNFSDNQNLSFDLQGRELAAIINKVLVTTGKTKVILVAHSMGGLAAREYLQGWAGTPYRGDVDKLITIGTPHKGSPIAFICENSLFALTSLCSNGLAVRLELEIGSSSLESLNLPTTPYSLPEEVSYISIIGKGTTNSFMFNEDGDGVVTETSQNLGAALVPPPKIHKTQNVTIFKRDDCGLDNIFVDNSLIGFKETHRCEPGDRGVWAAILRALR